MDGGDAVVVAEVVGYAVHGPGEGGAVGGG